MTSEETAPPYYEYPAERRALASFAYDPAGKLTGLRYVWQTLDNGVYPDEFLREYGYTYDQYKGLRKTMTETIATNSRTEEDRYDPDLDYLTEVDYDITGGYSPDFTWTYDPAGNRSNSGYNYDNLNIMTASPGHSYEHDILGNRTWRNPFSSTTVKYVWDDAGRLVKAAGPSNGATYSYRADEMRTKKVTGLTLAYIEDPESETSSGFYDEYQAVNHPTWRYRYDGQMCVEEDFTTVDGTTLTQTGTTYALGARGIDMLQPYSVNTSNWTRTYDAPHFPLYDGHGNMMATLSRSTSSPYYAVGNERQYDVWGGVRSGLSTGDPNTRYCANLGHKQDDESGLIYMRARYYEPGTGRFVSEDPARDGWNWYVYCTNSPTNRVDSSGESDYVVSTSVAIVALYGFLLGLANMRLQADRSSIAAMAVRFQALFLAAWVMGPNDGTENRDHGFLCGITMSAIGTVIGAAERGMLDITKRDRLAAVFAYGAFLATFMALTEFEENFGYLMGR